MKCRRFTAVGTGILIAACSFSSPLLADTQTGIASVYSNERTANGEYAHASALTAAHRTLPFGTMVEVTNTRTGRSVVVRINDRGPYIRGRVIDLTPAGARAIGSSGLAPVRLTVLSVGTRRASRSGSSVEG
jgi:rare lipoprotein A